MYYVSTTKMVNIAAEFRKTVGSSLKLVFYSSRPRDPHPVVARVYTLQAFVHVCGILSSLTPGLGKYRIKQFLQETLTPGLQLANNTSQIH